MLSNSCDPAAHGDRRDQLREARMKTSLGIWALGPMVTRFVPGGYQPERAGETTRRARAASGRRARRPDRRLRVPLPAGAERGEPRRRAWSARRARHLLHRDRAPSRPAVRQGRPRRRPDPATRDEAVEADARRDRLLRASSAPTSSSGRESRATTTRSRRRTPSRGHGSWTGSGRRPSAAESTGSRSSSSTRTPSRR